MAAYETVAPVRVLHSLHAYFLRPGDPSAPITMLVERTRDGRSFTHRRLSAEQHGLSMSSGDVLPMTIDPTMWLHAPARADRWWLYDLDSPWAGHGRALARGRVFDADGTLVAEVAQEGLVRRLR